MQKWECPCGYIYDPEEGDYENGVDPGTPWEKVPADWVCPKCGAAKEDFWKADQYYFTNSSAFFPFTAVPCSFLTKLVYKRLNIKQERKNENSNR